MLILKHTKMETQIVKFTEQNFNEEDLINENKSSKRKPRVPRSEIELLSVAKSIVENWTDDRISLFWITKDDFVQKVNNYETTINQLLGKDSSRIEILNELRSLNDEISKKISSLRFILKGIYGTQKAKEYYEYLNISSRGENSFPRNRERRQIILQQLLQMLEENEELSKISFDKEELRRVFERFSFLLNEVKKNTGNSSVTVTVKNENKELIYKTVKSLVFLFRANYPETWEAELRKLGLQKIYY